MTLPHGCSPINLLHIFKILFPTNTFEGLLTSCSDLQRIFLKETDFDKIKGCAQVLGFPKSFLKLSKHSNFLSTLMEKKCCTSTYLLQALTNEVFH